MALIPAGSFTMGDTLAGLGNAPAYDYHGIGFRSVLPSGQ